MTAQNLPDDPNYAFCPSYDLGDEPQQIRIVFEDMGGYVPTALVALDGRRCRAAVRPPERQARTFKRRLDGPRRPLHAHLRPRRATRHSLH